MRDKSYPSRLKHYPVMSETIFKQILFVAQARNLDFIKSPTVHKVAANYAGLET